MPTRLCNYCQSRRLTFWIMIMLRFCFQHQIFWRMARRRYKTYHTLDGYSFQEVSKYLCISIKMSKVFFLSKTYRCWFYRPNVIYLSMITIYFEENPTGLFMRVLGLNTNFHYLCVLCCKICPVVNKFIFSRNAHACMQRCLYKNFKKKKARVLLIIEGACRKRCRNTLGIYHKIVLSVILGKLHKPN